MNNLWHFQTMRYFLLKKKKCQTIRRPERNFTSILLMKEIYKKIIDTVKYPWLGQGLELGLGLG